MERLYWIVITLPLILIGCDHNSASEKSKLLPAPSAKTEVNQRTVIFMPRATYPASSPGPSSVTMQMNHPDKPRPTESLGIEVEPGRIVIDTRKMREALKNLGRQLHAKTMNSPSLHGAKNDGPDLGIKVSDEKVEIDLNKTRSFLKEWIGVMRALSDELDRSLAPQP